MKRTMYLAGVTCFVCVFFAFGLMMAEKAPAPESSLIPEGMEPSSANVESVESLEASLAVMPLEGVTAP